MSTHRKELEELRAKAINAGRSCEFIFDAEGRIDSVIYCGTQMGCISFAEIERTKPHYWQVGQPKKRDYSFDPVERRRIARRPTPVWGSS